MQDVPREPTSNTAGRPASPAGGAPPTMAVARVNEASRQVRAAAARIMTVVEPTPLRPVNRFGAMPRHPRVQHRPT